MRGRFPILRSGWGPVVTAAVVVAVAAGCGGSSSSTTSTGPVPQAEASFPGFRLAFRYPADWKRKNWCWLGTSRYPLMLLTTERLPRCSQGNLFGFKTELPPPMRLGPNDLAAWWTAFPQQQLKGAPNARVAGKPAHLVVRQEPTKRTASSSVNCGGGSGPKQRHLTAEVRGPGSGVGRVELAAVICGPNFAAGEAEVRKMLNTLRFTR
ncbi:MAG: hypothetical protein ACJ75L_02970 [Gaiellaceae bacterium]